MIEKGINGLNPAPARVRNTDAGNFFNSLKIGIFLVFIGIGMFVGYQLHSIFNIDRGIAMFGSIFISGGLALVLYYFLASNKINKEKTKD